MAARPPPPPDPTASPPPSPPTPATFAPVRVLAGFWEKAGAWAVPADPSGEGYWQVARRYPAPIGFCVLFVFASSWGQTFLLSVFQPAWMAALNIGPATMGAIYGGATLASGLLLALTGRWLDRTTPARLGTLVLLGLTAFALLAAASTEVWMLALALGGLRFFGQGLSANVGLTNAARWFTTNRGKAVSLAGLGFPLAEMILPGLVTLAVIGLGWRWTWVVIAAFSAFILLPLARALLARYPAAEAQHEAGVAARRIETENGVRDRSLLRDWRFHAMLGMMWALPFVGTGVIFFQGTIAAERGWSAAVFPTGFIVFAIVRALCSLSAGAWVDRLGAVRLLPVPGLAFAAGLACLIHPSPLGAYAFFAVLGLSFGSSGAITTSAWTEMFGAARIGEIRAMSSAFAIFVTAAAPVAFGVAFQQGIAIETLLVACVLVLLGLSWPLSLILRRAHRNRDWAAKY